MPTYTPLQSVELTSNTSTVTFSNIPQIYQDLVVIANVQLTASGQSLLYQYNGDTATSYSLTILKGNGTSATSDRRANINYQLAAGWDAGLPTSTSYANGIINIQNYSNTTTNKTSITRGSNAAGGDVTSTVCLWRNTAAITSVTLYTGSGSLGVGSTFDLYGISPVAADTAQAAGGTDVFYDSSFVYHVFKGSGTFTPYRNLTAEYLVIAGGGGGSVGGGGAGGYRTGTGMSLTANTTYTVTIGAGGAPNSATGASTKGTDSVFNTITSSGGGRGGSSTGGSGGGADSGGGNGSTGNIGGYTPAEGSNGGNSGSNSAGGGGGAGGAGGNGGSNTGGTGGAGSNSLSTWATATGTGVSGFYAGGGGGAAGSSGALGGTGGSGGGGNGQGSPSAGGNNPINTSGQTNTGSGGGGGWANYGLSGGSGIVIVRYAR